VPEATWVAVHSQCTSKTAGLARAIKSVAMAGPTAVVTEGLAGAASALGSVTDTWDYADGRWGLALPVQHGHLQAWLGQGRRSRVKGRRRLR
jgi:hypothetical protein